MSMTKDQLHEALVESGGVTQEQFDEAAARKEAAEIGVDGVLVSRGVMTKEEIGQLLALWYDVPFVNLRNREIDSALVHILPEAFARAHELLPIGQSETRVEIATSSPEDLIERSLLEKYLRKEVRFHYASSADLRAHMRLFQDDPQKTFEGIIGRQQTGTMDRRTIDLVDEIINTAYHNGASDIHIEPEDDYTLVRYRQDGILHDIAELPTVFHETIMTRLKVMARLATDEHRAAQDGKIAHKTEWGDEVEIRISIIPTTHAEKAVMRLLSDNSHAYSLAELGLNEEDYKSISDVIHKPWGSILVTGPTGSGKTTSLYAMLRVLNQRDVNVTTIEDPVEFDIEGVSQIQVNEKTGLTFAKGLRSIVRQDPDIIMVGEIRDTETASISVNAAMTGHLVLSTLHTNDAATAFLRLQEMEVEDFLIASTVNVVIAQRLVRKICLSCIGSTSLTDVQLQLIERIPNVKEYIQEVTGNKDVKKLHVFEGKGCHVCHQSGYQGRIGIFEVLPVSEAIRDAIMTQKNTDEIRAIATEEGMRTMLFDGIQKAVLGKTTIEEVLRVIRE